MLPFQIQDNFEQSCIDILEDSMANPSRSRQSNIRHGCGSKWLFIADIALPLSNSYRKMRVGAYVVSADSLSDDLPQPST
ncbi:unnamed protein product [Caenorhabditis brenneri]